MTNMWTTFTHTASRRIKSKAFVLTTAVLALLIIVAFNINSVLQNFGGDDDDTSQVAVVDLSETDGQIAAMLEEMDETVFEYTLYTDGSTEDAVEQTASDESDIDYVLELSGSGTGIEADFYGPATDFTVGQMVHQDVQRAKEAYATNELELSDEELALVFAPVAFTELPLSAQGDVQTQESHMQAYWMVYGLVFAIYIIVIMFGSMIATEVATEKSSRVMELIVSSVNPVAQMLGKLFGIGLAGLVNLAVLGLAIYIGASMSGEEFVQTMMNEVVDFTLILYALLLIILGYFLYGGIAAMLGALVSRAEEVNLAIQPLIFLAMIAFFIAMFGLNNPDTAMIQILSYVPFFTPQLLFLRIGMGTVPTWEIMLIIAVLLISAILINMAAARVYKGGVLMYGKFSFKNGIRQALKLSRKEG